MSEVCGHDGRELTMGHGGHLEERCRQCDLTFWRSDGPRPDWLPFIRSSADHQPDPNIITQLIERGRLET